jgi:hypothetical protein
MDKKMNKFKKIILLMMGLVITQSNASISSQFLFMTPSAPINDSVSALIRVICVDNNGYVTISNSEINNSVNEISFVQSVPISKMQSGVVRSHCINSLKFISYSPKGSIPTIAQTIKNGLPESC